MLKFMVAAAVFWSVLSIAAEPETPPNVIIILTDDLGYGDLGCYGQELVATPNIDQLAREGMRFTQTYAGASVCAPSRCALLTGRHNGHAAIRSNLNVGDEGQHPLPEGTFTLAHLFREAGYATGAFGKWALGFVDSTGSPAAMGFDMFFGYNCQMLAANYFPDHLWRNDERVELDGKTYSHDLIAGEMLAWIRGHAEKPFFIYYPVTIPHHDYQLPGPGPYADMPWSERDRARAGMMARLDDTVGDLVRLLDELDIADRTMIIFTSDNGADPGIAESIFRSNGSLRGAKRTMYEGGLRVPAIARWSGRIPSNTVNQSVWALYDLLPTMADLMGHALPADVATDGISIMPSLFENKKIDREFLYWELHEWRFIQAARMGDWKGVRNGLMLPLELYDLSRDPSESNDVAAEHPEVVRRILEIIEREHVPDPFWYKLSMPNKKM